MDARITLSFDAEVIKKAKAFAARNNMSLSRLTEYFYRSITSGHYKNLEELPIADWVSKVAEGDPEYRLNRRISSERKKEYYSSRKKNR